MVNLYLIYLKFEYTLMLILEEVDVLYKLIDTLALGYAVVFVFELQVVMMNNLDYTFEKKLVPCKSSAMVDISKVESM